MEKVTNDGITSYFYSARDKMIRVVLDDDSELNYSYYPESDLRFSTIDTSGIKQRFLYEGQNVVEEMDAYNGELVSYLEGMGIDQHLARVANGDTLAYVTDALGTVRNVVDASGVALNSYTFKAYGETREKTEAADNSYLYTGRRLEADTGDYYYRARYYLPQQGIFGAVDRYVPDEMTFAYAGGNPVMMVDPSGTASGLCWFVGAVYVGGALLGASDFEYNYNVLKITGLGEVADKYLHCKANCESSKYLVGGYQAAQLLSFAREAKNFYKDHSDPSECKNDMKANAFGRSCKQLSDCKEHCKSLLLGQDLIKPHIIQKIGKALSAFPVHYQQLYRRYISDPYKYRRDLANGLIKAH